MLSDRVDPRTGHVLEQSFLHIERNPVGRVVATVLGALTGPAAAALGRHGTDLHDGPDIIDLRFVPEIDESGVCALVAMAGRIGRTIEVAPSSAVRAAIEPLAGGCELELIEPTSRFELFRADFGVSIHDHELRFVYVNETLAEANGLAPHAHDGFRPDELFSPEQNDCSGVLERVVVSRLAEAHEFVADVGGERERVRSYVGPVDLDTGPGVVAVTDRVDGRRRCDATGLRCSPSPSTGCSTAATDAADARLTVREREVLDGLIRGESNATIAAELYLSIDTVKTYCQRIYRKLGVANRTQAAMSSRELRLRQSSGMQLTPGG